MHGLNDPGRSRPPLRAVPQPSELAADDPEGAIDLRAIAGVLRRQVRTIIASVVVVMGLALLVTSQLERRYTATALLVVNSRESQVLGMDSLIQGMTINTVVDTEVEIARSSQVLMRAVRALDLANAPSFAEGRPLWRRVLDLVGLTESAPDGASEPVDVDAIGDSERAKLIDRLARTLQITRRGLTSAISVAATAADATEAARRANAVAQAYLDEQVAAKLAATQSAADYLRSRVNELGDSIEALNGQIDNFVDAKMAELATPEARAAFDRLREDIARSDGTRETIRSLVDGYEGGLDEADAARIADLVGTDEARRLAAERTTAAAALAPLERSDAARAADVRQTLAALDAQLRTLAEAQASQTEQETQSLHDRLNDLVGRTLSREVTGEFQRLQSDLAARNDLYKTLLAQLRQVEQQTVVTLPDASIRARAMAPDGPSFPPANLILAAALIGGCGLGVGAAFVRERYVGGFSSVAQMEATTGVPAIAVVPMHKSAEVGATPDWSIVSEPLSSFSEAIRRMRLGVEAAAGRQRLCVFVTSSEPGEGKSTLALALARTFAMTGRQTILIDADMRHPSIHKFLARTPSQGLIDFLSQDSGADLLKLVTMKEPETGLSLVLGSEASRIATDALLMSERFASLVVVAREKFDIVVIDTPPVGLVVDAQVISHHADVALYVVKWASTNQRAVLGGLRELSSQSDIPLVSVMNQASRGSVYGYGGKYGDYYR